MLFVIPKIIMVLALMVLKMRVASVSKRPTNFAASKSCLLMISRRIFGFFLVSEIKILPIMVRDKTPQFRKFDLFLFKVSEATQLLL